MGLSDIVSTRYKVPDRESDEYKAFQEKNKLVYNALQYATAEGQAFIKVKKFAVSKDGMGAYSYLREFSDGQGSTETKATCALEKNY